MTMVSGVSAQVSVLRCQSGVLVPGSEVLG